MRAFEVEEEEGPEGKSSDVAEGGGRKVVEVLGEGTGERFDIVRGFSLLSLFGMEGKQRRRGRKEVEASSAASPIPLSLLPSQRPPSNLTFINLLSACPLLPSQASPL